MKKQSRILAFLLTLVMVVSLTFATVFIISSATKRSVSDLIQKELKLTYDEPAPDDDGRDPAFSNSKLTGWEVWALPLGNAYAGAKVFGITERERIQINENTLSTSGSTSNSGTTNFTETYVHFNHDYDNVTNYNRDLILNDSTSHVSYDYNGVTYTREYFASYPDGVIVLKFDASGEKNLDFTLEPKIPYYNYEYKYGYTYDGEDHEPADVKAELLDDKTALITLEGYLPGINDNGNGTFSTGYGMYFEGQFKVFTDGTLSVAHSGGSVDSVDEYSNGTVTVSDASTAYVIIALGTNYELDGKVFKGANNTKLDGFAHPHDKVSATIAAASEKSYDELREAHVADYSELFSRVALDLGGDPGDLTTDELLANYKADDKNAYVEELLFAYGRYLLISSSRDGALPPNLNGIWNRYHSTICMNGYWGNINIQMNYWSTFNTNLAECFSAYLGYYSAYAEANHQNAIYELKNKGYITSSGDVEGDLWSVATAHTPFLAGASSGGRDGWGNTPFMAEIFWDYYDYTGDKELLEETVFPAILACANFLSYVMQETEDGLYLSTSSGSPEQSTTDPYHTYVTSHPGYEPVGTGYDQSLTYSNYLHVLEAVEILGYTDQKLEELGILGIINRIRTQVEKLDPVVVGYSGQVKEFREENYYGEIGEPEHRHISHLCALVQGSIFNEAEAAAWLDAARVTMENRGSNKPYGWEAVMKIYSWARLRENEEAYKNLEFLINTCLGYNMMTLLSNAFQVEANLGAPAAMSDMLLQSHEGFIAPLAALPSAWADGAYSGLVARGGFEVGAAWTDGFADEFVIVSNNGGECTVKYINIATATVKDQNGNTVAFTKNGSDFITFDTEAGSTYTITNITEGKATEKPTRLAVEYDADGAHLSWAASANAASYNVYRSANSESAYTLMASGVKATDYVIDNTDFNPSNQYTYAVSAVSASGRESARAHATMIPILAPNEAKGLLVGSELTVYISEVAGNEINYRIYEEKGGVRKLAHESSHLTAVLANASKDSIYTVVSVIDGIESAEFVTVNVEEKIDGPYKVDSNNLFLNKDIRIVQNEKYTIDGTEYTSGPHTTGSASYPLSNVVDNNPALESRWAIANTNYAHPLMVEIDCENSCELGMLTITAYKLYNPCILILASVDGETFTTAAMKYDEKLINCAYGSAIQIDLTGTTARYVRIVFNATAETDNGYTACASVCEIACPGRAIIEQTPSKLELQKAIENAEAIDTDTIAAIAPDFLNVLKDAIAIFENESASKSKIDEAVVTLNAATGDLKSAEQLVSDSASRDYGNFTFEFDEDGSGKYMTSSPDREAIPAWSVGFAGQPINAVTESDLDNRYLSFVYKSGSAALTNTAYWEILTSDWYAKFSKYKNGEIDDFLYSGATYDYAVFDMDFTTHQYVYTTADGKLETGVTVPEGATDVKLAYPEGAMIYPIFRSYAIGATEAMQGYTRMKLVSENGKWYITRNTDDDGRLISENPKDKIELKEGIGEWNHVTTVIKTNRSSLKDSQIHIFVNGELIAVYRPTNSSIEKFNFASYRIDFTKDTIGSTPFELDIDNITTNLYGTGDGSYSGDLKKLTDGEIALKECSDAVYNRDYVYPDGSNNAEEAADVATVVYPDGSTKTVAVGSAITPKEFTTAEDGAKLYYGANNTLYKDDAAEGWIFTVEGEATALADLTVTAEMVGKKIIASGVDKVYFTIADANGTVYHTTNTAHGYMATTSIIKIATTMTLYEDVNAESFLFKANGSGFISKLDLNGHTVAVQTTTKASYIRIYIYSSKPGAHYYCADAGGIASTNSSIIYFGDDGTGSYVNNISFHTSIITKGNNYHVYVIGGHYYQTEATSAFLDMTRYLRELKNATFYLYPGTDAVLAADEAFSGAAVHHGDIATGAAAINNCIFYSADGNIPVLYSTTGATPKFTNCKFYGVAATADGTNGTVTADATNTVNGAIVYNTVTWYDGTTEIYYATSKDAALAYVQSLPKAKAEIDLDPIALPSEDGTKMYYINEPVISLTVDEAFNAVQTVDGEKMTVYFTKTTTDGTTYYYGDVATVNTELIHLLTTRGSKNSELKFYSDFTLTAASYIRMNMGNATHKIDLNGYKLTINFTAAVNYALCCEYGVLYIYSSREGGVIDSRSSKSFWYTDTSGSFYLGEPDASDTRYSKNFTLICKALNTGRLYSTNGYILGGTYIQPEGTSGNYFFAQGNSNGNIQIQNATFILNDVTTAWMKGGCEHDGVIENVTIIAKNQTALFEPLDNFNKDITFKNCYFYNVTPTLIDGATYTYENCSFNKLYDAQANGIFAYTDKIVLTVNGTDYVFNTTVSANDKVGTVNWGFGITEPWVIGATATHKNAIVDGMFGYTFGNVTVVAGENKANATLAAIMPGTLQMSLTLQSNIRFNLIVSEMLNGATVKIGNADAVAIAGAITLQYAIAPNVANLDVPVIITIGDNAHTLDVSIGEYATKILESDTYTNAHNLTYAMVEYVRVMTNDASFLADTRAPASYTAQTLTGTDSGNKKDGLLSSIAFRLDGTIAIAIKGTADAEGKEVNLVLATGRSERANIKDGIVIFEDLYVNEFFGDMTLTVAGEDYTYNYNLANYLHGLTEDSDKAAVQALYNYAYYADLYVKNVYWSEATVTVKYLKDDGTLIKTEQLTDKPGTEYSFKSPTVDGYYTRDMYVKGTLKKNTTVQVVYSEIPQNADPEHISSILPGIVCWGDSLTMGVGRSNVTAANAYGIDLEALNSAAQGCSYVDVLSNLIQGKVATGINVANCGVGGESSAVIAARAMTESYYLYIGKDVTVGSGESVEIDIQQYSPEGRLGILRQGEGNSVNVVTIIGKDSEGRDVEVKGRISVKLRDGATGDLQTCDYSDLFYTFQRTDTGETATLPSGAKIVTKGSYTYDGDWCVIFMGQNGGYTGVSELIAQQQEILDACECDSNYIIIGLSSGNAAERAEMEAAMTDYWGSHYFSARAALSSEKAYKDAGFSDSVIEANRASIDAGKISNLFLHDGLHLNAIGYALLGNAVFTRMVELDYFDAIYDYYDSLYTISAPKYKDMQKFSHWEDSKGNVVSEELTYTYESPIEQSYNPVYVDFIEMQGVLLDNNTKYDAAAKRYDSTNDPTNGWLKMGYFTESLTKGMFVEFTIEKQSGTQQLAWGISTKEYVEAYNASPTTNGWLTNDPTNDLAKLFVAEYNIYSGTSNSSREADSWLTQVSDISQVSNGKTEFTNPSIDLKTLIENNDTIKVKYVFDDRLLMYVNGQLFTATNIPDWSIADGKEYHLSFSGSNVKMFVSDIGYDAYITNKGNYSALKSDPLTEDAFSGKTITFLGDSITLGVGVSEPRPDHRYSSVLAASLGMTEINMGISGTVMCTGGHRTSRLADIQNISYSSDYVGVLLGVNDYDQCRNNASDKYYSLGEFGSKDTTTIYGALDKMCSDLVNRFRETDTKIFMMTPVVTSWNSSIGVQYWDNNKVNACGYSLRDLCDAIEEVATYYGIVTLDLNELCEMSASDFSDGLHPNDAGAQKMANTVKEFLLANYSFE